MDTTIDRNKSMESEERAFMAIAIEKARNSRSEDERIHPKVGVVVVRDGELLASATRGETEQGAHAEFTVLEKMLADKTLAGATVYTTLEPCTTRNHPKIPCAERLIERKVAKVFIGILDPNPDISGKGQRRLREAGIETALFPGDLMSQIEEMNREFIRLHHQDGHSRKEVAAEFIEKTRGRSLDEWV